MRRSKLFTGVLALIGVMLAVPALSAAGGTTQLSAKLKGNEEVPAGSGDKNGKGEIFVAVKPKREKLCFQLEFSNIEGAAAGHVHKGLPGVDGPIKVTLFVSSPAAPGPTAEGCVRNQKKKLLRKIAREPEKFYVNIHNEEFPDGAIRGQLEPAV